MAKRRKGPSQGPGDPRLRASPQDEAAELPGPTDVRPHVPAAALVTMAAILAGLGVLAWREAHDWDSIVREPRHGRALAERADYRAALAHGVAGDGLAERGDVDGALREYREALRLEPTTPGIHNNLGALWSRMGRVDEAIAEYRAELALNPASTATRDNLGIELARAGRLDEAVHEFQQVLRLDPASAGAHYRLAHVWAEAGRLDEAIVHFREVLRIRPDFAAAREDLDHALALSRTGQR